jgi:hypothetical protein
LATVAAQTSLPIKSAPGRRYDHLFFSVVFALIFISVFIGFARTYFLAGVFRAPLPATVIHVHGAVFSCWVLLLLVQTALVSAHRVDIHRRLGVFGFCLAVPIVILGVLAATNALVRNSAHGVDPRFFYIIPISQIFISAVLIFFAFVTRSNSAIHKRLILIASVSLLTAAFARWPLPFLQGKPVAAMLTSYSFLVALALYDVWSTHKVQRATLIGSAFLIFVELICVPLGHSAAWLDFAGWIQRLAR